MSRVGLYIGNTPIPGLGIIHTGGYTPTGMITLTENGVFNISQYAYASIEVEGECEIYHGTYDVCPCFSEQTLPTKNKQLISDLIIEEIPYSEVTNPSGGLTINIGG